jgi:hypothetical protein
MLIWLTERRSHLLRTWLSGAHIARGGTCAACRATAKLDPGPPVERVRGSSPRFRHRQRG